MPPANLKPAPEGKKPKRTKSRALNYARCIKDLRIPDVKSRAAASGGVFVQRAMKRLTAEAETWRRDVARRSTFRVADVVHAIEALLKPVKGGAAHIERAKLAIEKACAAPADE